DVAALDCDFLVCSGHKMLGPTGIGVLYGRPALLEAMEPAQGGGGMIRRVTRESAEWAEPPWKFEAGTPNIAGAVGLGAAVDYLSDLGLDRVAAHEAALAARALRGLEDVAQVRLYGPLEAPPRAGVLAFNLDGLHPHDVCQVLDTLGVAVRGGHHCCQVLMERLAVPAVVRASLAPYNDEEDVDRLLAGLRHVHRVLGHG
ncbi:MAG TPA: aminotransferase class V-fold PLP-dependent enzyme, partial [bacterium]|nr:aminotransferase class V-fold PLP-dependent enzyme [bacterium]